jgi:hypothetical protein
MKGITRCVALVAAFFVVTLAFDRAEADYVILGAGTHSCGAWTKEHANDSVRANIFDNWVAGYITSHNRWALRIEKVDAPKKSVDIARNIDFDGIVAWITNWCRDNPLESVADATGALILELRKRKGW